MLKLDNYICLHLKLNNEAVYLLSIDYFGSVRL